MLDIQDHSPAHAALAGLVGAALAAIGMATACGGDGSTAATTEPAAPPGGSRAEGRIVFRRLDPGAGKVRLYTMRPNGSGLKAITLPGRDQDDDSQADWSPQGRRIAFRRFVNVGRDDERTDLFVVRPDGSGVRNLTRASCEGDCLGSEEPAWSPDGTRIAFMRALGPLSPQGFPATVAIFVMDADGSHVRQLTQLRPGAGSEDHSPSWSPDGRRIAFMRFNTTARPESASAIYTVDADGGKAQLLRRMPRQWPGAGSPDWSPDGSRILFTTYCAFGDCGQPPTGAQLFTIDTAGGRLRQVTHLAGNSYNPRWSPDGKHITFARNPRLGPEGDVYTIRANGSELRRLTHRPKLNAHYPDWGEPR
jgi:TolB protein